MRLAPWFALCLVGFAALLWFSPARANTSTSAAPAIAFLRHDNVWVAGADGRAARQLTQDGTGTRMVRNRQVTYFYLSWAPDRRHLLVGRFESINPPSGSYRQEWSLRTWTPGRKSFAVVARGIDGADFIPAWSDDAHAVAYMASSRYDNKTTLFRNQIVRADLFGRTKPLARFAAHEGCLDGTSDPSELTFWGLVGPGGIRQTFIWSSARGFLIYATQCIHTGLHYRDLSTGKVREVGRHMIEAALSPDGRRLAGIDAGHLILTTPDGSVRHSVAGTAGARLPVWSPDGRFVYMMARHRLRTLHYRDRAGNVFEIQVDRSSLLRADVQTGTVVTMLTRAAHAFSNLSPTRDGRWLYFTSIGNSDQLYQHLHGSPSVTASLLQRYAPKTTVMRIPVTGGRPQPVASQSGEVAVRN